MRSVPTVQRPDTIVSRAFRESIAVIKRQIEETDDPNEIACYRAVLSTFPKEYL